MLKKMLYIFLSIIILFILGVVLFLALAPQIGQTPVGKDLERIKKSPNHNGEIFINQIETNEASFGEAMSTVPDFIWNKNGSPKKPIPVAFGENKKQITDSSCFITWYGHSAFLLELKGKRILIDPMLGESSSPIYLTTKRFNYQKDIPIEKLKNIDAVIISHDHYDHLDYPTIKKLSSEVKHFFTPLGVGSHLKSWGIEPTKITELDWWQSAEIEGIHLEACPSRHFSGRGLTGRNTSLWASWIIKSNDLNIYFSGDGGYGSHFKEIGKKYGPFDFAMIECGQYNKAWKDIHMMPEESVQAGVDVKAKAIMPIHWGAFQLSVHSWQDPVLRFVAKAKELEIQSVHPLIGERFELNSKLENLPNTKWWEKL